MSVQLFVTSLLVMVTLQQLSGSAGITQEVIFKYHKVDCALFVCSVDAGRL